MIGVDYDLFWTLNPKSMKPFVKAFELKRTMDNHNAWLQGVYIRLAIVSALSKNSPYPKKPLSLEKKDRIMSPEEIKQKMFDMMKIINPRLEQGGENEQ